MGDNSKAEFELGIQYQRARIHKFRCSQTRIQSRCQRENKIEMTRIGQNLVEYAWFI